VVAAVAVVAVVVVGGEEEIGMAPAPVGGGVGALAAAEMGAEVNDDAAAGGGCDCCDGSTGCEAEEVEGGGSTDSGTMARGCGNANGAAAVRGLVLSSAEPDTDDDDEEEEEEEEDDEEAAADAAPAEDEAAVVNGSGVKGAMTVVGRDMVAAPERRGSANECSRATRSVLRTSSAYWPSRLLSLLCRNSSWRCRSVSSFSVRCRADTSTSKVLLSALNSSRMRVVSSVCTISCTRSCSVCTTMFFWKRAPDGGAPEPTTGADDDRGKPGFELDDTAPLLLLGATLLPLLPTREPLTESELPLDFWRLSLFLVQSIASERPDARESV